jgi:N-acetylglucosaminyldiphosphoundecaprenol N-acetyl-beta-D-mannosaminyltransferase
MSTALPPAALKAIGYPVSPQPHQVVIEEIPVTDYPTREALLQAVVDEAKRPGTSVCLGMNAHNANMAYKNRFLKKLYQQAQIVYCDGAGVILASRLLGDEIPVRYANGDWFFEMWDYFAAQNCTSYYLGSAPGIALKGLSMYEATRNQHNILGVHHGYILNDPELEAQVIAEINALKPDVLFVGFGCPLQEKWIVEHIHELNVGLCYAIGASMDYVVGVKPRPPEWMGNIGGEWLFRLFCEPKRLYHRYLVGNPWFLGRVALSALGQKLKDRTNTPLSPTA